MQQQVDDRDNGASLLGVAEVETVLLDMLVNEHLPQRCTHFHFFWISSRVDGGLRISAWFKYTKQDS
jgi:hypothetical protein